MLIVFDMLEKTGGSVKKGRGRKARALASSYYHSQAPRRYPLGVERVTESGPLLSKSPYFLCRSAFARDALQA